MTHLTVRDIVEKLEQNYPYRMAMDWDNPGLQVGRMDGKADRVMVALDATDEVVDQCVRAEAKLLITHHPLLISGIRKVNDESMAGRRILAMAEHGIAHYAIHTNYDTAMMSDLAADRLSLWDRKILEVTGETDGKPYGIGYAGRLSNPVTAGELCAFVKKAFDLEAVRLFGAPDRKVQYIAISPGSGKSMIKSALASGAELLITGDIGHHDGIDAADQGMMIMDAGHYGIEHIFVSHMEGWLKEMFPQAEVLAVQEKEPFVTL